MNSDNPPPTSPDMSISSVFIDEKFLSTIHARMLEIVYEVRQIVERIDNTQSSSGS